MKRVPLAPLGHRLAAAIAAAHAGLPPAGVGKDPLRGAQVEEPRVVEQAVAAVAAEDEELVRRRGDLDGATGASWERSGRQVGGKQGV
jgi:hypothetical protein